MNEQDAGMETPAETGQTPSESSEATPLDTMRGVGDAFRGILDEEAIKEGGADEVTEEETPAEEESTETTSEDEGVDDTERRLAAADADKVKSKQERLRIRKQLKELDPAIQIGSAVLQNPRLRAIVQQELSGKKATAVKKGKMTPDEFMDAMVEKLKGSIGEIVQQRVASTMDESMTATRKWNDIDKRAHKELDNFDVISKHPSYMKWVTRILADVQEDIELGEDPCDGEDPYFWAMREGHDYIQKKHPDYTKAHRAAGKKEALRKAEKKAVASSIATSSRKGSTATGKDDKKLSQEEQDRLSPLVAFLKGSSGRRLPGAK